MEPGRSAEHSPRPSRAPSMSSCPTPRLRRCSGACEGSGPPQQMSHASRDTALKSTPSAKTASNQCGWQPRPNRATRRPSPSIPGTSAKVRSSGLKLANATFRTCATSSATSTEMFPGGTAPGGGAPQRPGAEAAAGDVCAGPGGTCAEAGGAGPGGRLTTCTWTGCCGGGRWPWPGGGPGRGGGPPGPGDPGPMTTACPGQPEGAGPVGIGP
mmetsp:Transcript_122653/g.392684  ORF Transcript_122653/g.392684 Transcript_122653/m.392684 type:complete len:213 (+) Transcript_122653:1325-1963(+)